MTDTTGVPRCAVLGRPIAHSLSPVLHRAAYAELGLDWRYDAVETAEADLPGFLASLDDTWRGLSLTMPLKRTVVPLLDELSERAAVARAVNTVVLSDGRRTGDNTDIPGIVAALAEVDSGPVRTALVLGGGATAASAALALCDLTEAGQPVELTLAVRDRGRVRETLDAVARHARPVTVDVVEIESLVGRDSTARRVVARRDSWDLLLSTVPAAAQAAEVAPLVELAERAAVVFEVLYEPWPTPLAAAAARAGRPLVGGLDLLVHQAVLQVELMTGLPAPLETMRAAGRAALEARS